MIGGDPQRNLKRVYFMSYPNVWLHVLNNVADLIKRPSGQAGDEAFSAVATGAHDVLFTPKYLRKYGIHTVSNEDMAAHMCAESADFYRSSNTLAARVLKSYGYDSYVDIDIYDRADIVCDLSTPMSEEHHQKYDLVLDIISTYVTNIIQSYSNTSSMTKIGGTKIVVTTVGDQTNRFELNPSPNFLIDFHLGNGFEFKRGFMINPKGTILPYRRYATKGTPAFALLPIFDWFLTSLKTLNTMRSLRPFVRKGEYIDYPARPDDNVIPQPTVEASSTETRNATNPNTTVSTPGLRYKVKNFLRATLGENLFMKLIFLNRKIRYSRRAFLHDNFCHEWYAYFVFQKVEELDNPHIHITSHYEDLNQTKL